MKSVGKKVKGRGNCNHTHAPRKEARERRDPHQIMGNKMNKHADRERKSRRRMTARGCDRENLVLK